ncbi:MAG: hypothetical protein D6707_10835 [Bacteroidetes bacterium]|nr:MAG: hypothetical protein D6707_10835 [Bacteroidota bacterium]
MAQTPDTVTFYSIGGIGEDVGRAIYPTQDKGYILSGTTESFGRGSTDIYIVKLDSLYQIEFSQTYGGSNIDYATDVIQLPDKSYLVTGYSNSFNPNGDYDGYLLKIDSSGNKIFEKTFGTANWDFIYAIQKNPYGEVVVCGESFDVEGKKNQAYAVCFNTSGQKLWEKHYGSANGNEVFYDVALNYRKNFLLAGSTDGFNALGKDVFMIEINQMGDSLQGFVIHDTLDQEAYCIQESPYDSSWVMGGYAISTVTQSDSNEYILKFKDGSVLWKFQYDYAPGTHDFVTDAVALPNGDFYFVGYTNTSFYMPHITAYRVNRDGYPYLAENLRVHYPAGKTQYTPKIALHHDSAFAVLAHSSFYSSNFNDFLFIPLKRPYSVIERDTVVYLENIITRTYNIPDDSPEDILQIKDSQIILTRKADKVSIYDISGKKIMEDCAVNPFYPLQISEIQTTGIYLIDIQQGDIHYLRKWYYSR